VTHTAAAEQPASRMTMRFVVELAAGPGNRYRGDRDSGAVVLNGLDFDIPRRPLEQGHLMDTRGSDGLPLRALVAVRIPTFAGCLVPVHPVGMALSPDGKAPVVIAVPAVDQSLAAIREVGDLPETVRQAIDEVVPGATIAPAAAAEDTIRAAREAHRRAALEAAHGRRSVPAWKVADERAPLIDGREAQPHTFAEQAVPKLPARFQEYIARALLPEERILMFIHRPATEAGGGFRLRRTKLREGIMVLTDRQVLFMIDSLEPGSLLVHWGYIARVSAVERIAGVQVRTGPHLVGLDVTFAAARGAETVSFELPASLKDAAEDAADLLRAFVPRTGTRALRRRYARALPRELPSLAEYQGEAEVPAWAEALLPDERLLAWAQAPLSGGPSPQLVVGERRVALTGGRRQTGGVEFIAVDDITSLEMTLSLIGSGLEIAVGDGEAVRRAALRFDYPAAPRFLAAFTAIRHLMGLPAGGATNGDA
jgi:inorganic pyrophosphatase